MNKVEAVRICKNLGSDLYTEKDKIRAVHAVIYGALPLAAIDGALAVDIAKWLFEKKYGYLIED